MVTIKAFNVSFCMNQFHAPAVGKYLICKSLALETNSFFLADDWIKNIYYETVVAEYYLLRF
jgi:hypothetical protein